MRRRKPKPLHPATSALAIVFVILGVWFAWWRFLVYTPPPNNRGGGPMGGGAMKGPPVYLVGRADVFVKTFAGNEQPGDTDGPGHAARFDRPTGLALDSRGDLYIADTGNHRIRMITPAGETSTVAGSEPGFADGPAARARFNAPCGVCVGPDGAVFVADTGNHCIRKIKDGQVTTLPSGPTSTAPPDPGAGLITAISYVPGASPGLVVADTRGARVRQYTLDGALKSDRGVGGGPVSVAGAPELAATIPASGTVLIGSKSLKDLPFEATDDETADVAAKMKVLHPIGVSPMGKNWLLTDNDYRAVLMIVNDRAQVVAGYCSTSGPGRGFRDGDGSTCLFANLAGIVFDGKKYAYVADTGNNSVRRLDLTEMLAQ